MTDTTEQRIARLERELGRNDDDFREKVVQVITALGRQYGRPEVAREALREMGIEDSSDPKWQEITLKVVIRAKPSSELMIEDENDFDSMSELVQNSIPDLARYSDYILDSDWTDTEIHSVEVEDVAPVGR